VRRCFTRRDHPDAGMSLVELTVAMSIVGVLILAVGAVTISSFKAMRIATVKIAAGADARVAMETMSRTLRVAVVPAGEPSAITVGSYDSISFYALLSRTASVATPLPTLVEYYRDLPSNCLMEAQTPARMLAAPGPTGSLYAWDTGRVTHCVAHTAQIPTAASPWFSYYTSGQLLTGGVATVPLTVPTGGLLLADRQSVRSVEATLTVTDPANPTVTGVSDEVQVTLDNVSLSNGGGA
jgi:prepilin-type N-terminal cleavage/methylation domain-containing protein